MSLHRLKLDKHCVIVCGDGFLEEFDKIVREEIKRKYNMISNYE